MRTTASFKDCSDAFDSLTGFAGYGLRPGFIPDATKPVRQIDRIVSRIGEIFQRITEQKLVEVRDSVDPLEAAAPSR
jgi:hypothetical protein